MRGKSVDFHYEVNGQKYDFSVPGGGFVSFYDLVETLGVAVDDADTETDEIQELIDGVKSITFSNPNLVSVSKVEEDSTVGAIKKRLGLKCEYSEQLTQEQVESIDAQVVRAGDWALISLKPFDTEESLTVTMETGEVFTISVTDANVAKEDVQDGTGYLVFTKGDCGGELGPRSDVTSYRTPRRCLPHPVPSSPPLAPMPSRAHV